MWQAAGGLGTTALWWPPGVWFEMKNLFLGLTLILAFLTANVALWSPTWALAGPAYSPDQVKSLVFERLRDMKPPITEIYYYDLYKWKLVSHHILNASYGGSGRWEVLSHASFDGYHKGLSVGRDGCALRWHFDERTGSLELVENNLLSPEGTPASSSRSEVIHIVAKHLSDMHYDNAPLNYHDTAHFKLNYLGYGKWEVRVVITNAVGLWVFDERNQDIQFLGRLGP